MFPGDRSSQRPGTAPPGAQPGYGNPAASPAPPVPPMPGQYGHPAAYSPAAAPYTPQQSYAAPPQASSPAVGRASSLKPKAGSSAFKLFDQTLHTVNRIGGYAVPGLSNAINDLRGKFNQPQPGGPGQVYYDPPQLPAPYYGQPSPGAAPALPPRPPTQPGYDPNNPPALPPRPSPQAQPAGYLSYPPQSQGVTGAQASTSPPPALPQQPQPMGASYGPPPPQYVPSHSPGTPSTPFIGFQQQQPEKPPISQHGPLQPQYAAAQAPGPYGAPSPPPVQHSPQHQQTPAATGGYGPPQPQYSVSPPPTSAGPAAPHPPPQTGWMPPQPGGFVPPQSQYTSPPPPGAASPSFGSPALYSPGVGTSGPFPPQTPQYASIVSPIAQSPAMAFPPAVVPQSAASHEPAPPPYSPFVVSQPPSHIQELPQEPATEKPRPENEAQQQWGGGAPGVFIAELDSTAPAKPASPPAFCQELPGESAVPKPKAKPMPAGPQPGPPPGFPRNLPSIRLEGPGNSILAVCRQGRVDNFSTWYLANSAPGFTVCSRCYTDHIAHSRHTGMFDGFTGSASPDGSFVPGHVCNFSSHTVQGHIWPKALETHSTAPLASFMVRRGGVRNCKDKLDRRSSRWFAPVASAQEPEFVVCEGCFFDNLSSGPFATQFAALDESAPVPDYDNCIFRASPFTVRAIATHEKDGNWPALLESARKRLALPKCMGQPVQGGQWFTTKTPIPNFAMCETCYIDNIASSKYEEEIVRLPTETAETRVCSMLNTNGAPIILAMDAAREFSNFSIFFDVAAECAKLPPCGHPQATYLTLANSNSAVEEFTVCSLHAQAYLAAFNITPHLLTYHPRPPAAGHSFPPVSCALSRTAQHTMTYLSAAQTSSDLGLLLPFQTAISKLALLPPCPKNVPISDGLWYGWRDSPICPSCYEAVCVGTALAGIGHLPTLHATTIAEPTPCVLYSARMRALFAHMSKSGNVEGFREACEKRRRAWMELEAVRRQREINSAGPGTGDATSGSGAMEQMMQGLNLGLRGTASQKVSAVRSLPSQTGDTRSLGQISPPPPGSGQGEEEEAKLQELEKIWADLE